MVSSMDRIAAFAEVILAAEFDTLLSDESNHRDELRQMLARWP